MDLSFAWPVALWGLLAVPVLALLEWRARSRARQAMRALAGPREGHVLLQQVLPNERRTGIALRCAALTLLVLGAAGPQWGRETVRRAARGSDLVFAIDVSASMSTRDVAPSRIDEARREALALLERVTGSRVGVLAFAGDAVRLCPLTLDHAAARLTLETLATGSVSTPGTDLGGALEAAMQMLPAGRREEQAIVLWTDGEDLEGHAGSLVDKLRGTGVRIFAVGVGTAAGDVIPVLDDQGRIIDVKRDDAGGTVHSRLDEQLLRDLARATRGGYFAANRVGGELGRLAVAMGSLARSSHGARLVERPVARFPLAAAAAVLLVAAELARPRRRGVAKPGRAKPGAAAAALLALVLALGAGRADAQTAWAKADRAFKAGDWARAESLYARRARRRAPEAVHVNLATSRALAGRPPQEWQPALERLGNGKDYRAAAAAGYNLGTVLGERKDFDAALAQLRHALERDPDDADARWNYELLMREKRQQDEEKKKQQSPQSPKPQQQPQQGPSQPSPGGQQPQPNGGTPPPQGGQQPQGQSPPQSTPGSAQGMTRQQAEQLLGSLQELERLERQRAQRTRATTEKKGKDW